MTAIHVRFFDRFLRKDANELDDEPRIWLYDPGAKAWKTRRAWNGETRELTLFMSADAALTSEPAPDGEDEYQYDPLDAPGVRFDVRAPLWEPPLDLAELESQAGVLRWTSDALAEDAVVHGWVTADLWAATDGDDTDWHVKLADVDETGRSLCVGWGCLRASYGKDLSRPEPVKANQVIQYRIELTPTFHTFRRGHRVRIVLASAEYPWFARNLNRFGPIRSQADPRVATNTVHYGLTTPSCVHLPVEG
jgi:putative CocE/NonD family hydrolase